MDSISAPALSLWPVRTVPFSMTMVSRLSAMASFCSSSLTCILTKPLDNLPVFRAVFVVLQAEVPIAINESVRETMIGSSIGECLILIISVLNNRYYADIL